MGNTRSGSPRPSQGPCKTRMQNKNNQATTKSPLIPEMPTSKRTGTADVDISPTWKAFNTLQKETSARTVINLGTLQACAFMKGQQKQAYHKPCKPKAHQLTAGTIQAYDSQSESENSDSSFCLQLPIKCVQS